MRYQLLSVRSLLGFAAGMGILLFGTSADASESAVLKYRFLRASISVRELTTFAETGQISTPLGFYLKLAGKDTQEMRRLLKEEVKVNPLLLYQVLKSPFGEVLLDQVSEVVHTPDNLANRESLRAALVSSALPDRNITLLEILQNYPTQEVHVEGERLAEVYGKLSRLARRLPRL